MCDSSDSTCVFCRIITGQEPANIVYEDDQIVVFVKKPQDPKIPLHLLIIPKQHIESLATATEKDAAVLAHIQLMAPQLAQQHGVAASGYRLHTNVGQDGGQTLNHLHYHLQGGTNLGASANP